MTKKMDLLFAALVDWRTVPSLAEQFGWKANTLSARLSVGSRERGVTLERKREAGVTSYRIKPADYQPRDDLNKSVDAAYEAIRERQAAGGPGWRE